MNFYKEKEATSHEANHWRPCNAEMQFPAARCTSPVATPHRWQKQWLTSVKCHYITLLVGQEAQNATSATEGGE
jgi:hypothetical protein